MTTFTEPTRNLDVLAWEVSPQFSREKVTVASGAGVLGAGRVLGKITSSGKYAAYDNTASDGTQTAVGVLLYNIDATSADVVTVAVVRMAIVKTALLDWGSNDSTGKTAGLADMAPNQIVAR
jgi:head decoration protein D